MAGDVIEAKAALRREMRARLQGITPEQRAIASREICARLQQSAVWNSARTILFFAPMLDEPDLWPLLEKALAEKKLVALPRYVAGKDNYVVARIVNSSTDLRAGKFGIREPLESCAEIQVEGGDLMLVPGIAFDAQGRRLGRGRGFYDRLLAGMNAVKCGVSFDEQMIGEVPAGPADGPVDIVLTPTQCWKAGRAMM